MPYTINGVGTHYYGKKNRESSVGICENCHQQVDLQTYETRTWFCVIFIPIIPLGKKQILDYCPKCTTHRALPHQQWQEVKNEAIQESATELQGDQDNPEAGMQMMQTLAAFKKNDEATKLGHVLIEKHPENAQVQFAVGGWLEHVGETEVATNCFESAYLLEPDELAYKRAWGMTLAERGQMNDARELLRDLEPGQEDYDASVMLFLTTQCQKSGDHIQAVEIFGLILEVNPEFSKDASFRKMVLESENAIGVEQSILPRKGVNKKTVGWLVAIALLAACIFGYSHYLSQNRDLVVVNGGSIPLTVQIDEQSVDVPAFSTVVVPFAEGTHSFKVLKPEAWNENVGSFEMSSHTFARIYRSPVFVLDPAKSGVLVWEEATYAAILANSRMDDKLHIGKSFYTFDNIDHIFEEFPDSVTTKSGKVVRTRIDFVLSKPGQIAALLSTRPEVTAAQLKDYLETHLLADPSDSDLLVVYARQPESAEDYQRVHAFLEKGITRRPLEIEWHRTYQGVAQRIGKSAEMFKQYEEIASQNPKDSAALYLRGRIDPESQSAGEYFDRSIAADPKNSFPWYAKCHRSLSIGDYADAKKFCEKALELRPDDFGITSVMFRIRVALGEFGAIETECKASLVKEPFNMSAHWQLMSMYATHGEIQKMQDAHDALTLQVKKSMQGDPFEFLKHSERYIHYAKRDLANAEKTIRSLKKDEQNNVLLLQAQIEQNAYQMLTRADLPEMPTQRGFLELYLYLGHKRDGEDAKADEWFKFAIEDFENGDEETKRIADILKNSKGDELADRLFNLSMQSSERMVITLTAATLTEGDTREKLKQLVRKLNYMKSFPYYFVEDTLAKF
jgi:tetratricopeptide (TPR) repeat protein